MLLLRSRLVNFVKFQEVGDTDVGIILVVARFYSLFAVEVILNLRPQKNLPHLTMQQ